jgi:hypothetical protein
MGPTLHELSVYSQGRVRQTLQPHPGYDSLLDPPLDALFRLSTPTTALTGIPIIRYITTDGEATKYIFVCMHEAAGINNGGLDSKAMNYCRVIHPAANYTQISTVATPQHALLIFKNKIISSTRGDRWWRSWRNTARATLNSLSTMFEVGGMASSSMYETVSEEALRRLSERSAKPSEIAADIGGVVAFARKNGSSTASFALFSEAVRLSSTLTTPCSNTAEWTMSASGAKHRIKHRFEHNTPKKAAQ